MTQSPSVRDVLIHATQTLSRTSASPRLDAELLLGHVLGWSRTQLVVHRSDTLSHQDDARFTDLVARRSTGESVAYITNQREFYGHTFYVDARVLVPRPETELLVDCAIAAARILNPAVIVDIGSGSGCISVALALAAAATTIIAVDISPEALAVTTINRDAHQLGNIIHIVRADSCTAIAPVNMIVSNPPYIMDDDGDPAVRLYEPHLALFGGDSDGAAFYRRLAALLPHHLKAPGFFACELDPRQAQTVCTLLQTAFPHGRITLHHDLAGHARVVCLWLDV